MFAGISTDFGWVVAGNYVIEQIKVGHDSIRTVKADWNATGGHTCRPGRNAQLPLDFASCEDQQTLLHFIRKNGLLGFERLYPSWPSEGWKGDPVQWALDHARIVRGVLNVIVIIDGIRKDRTRLDDRSVKDTADLLARVFRNIGMKGPRQAEGLPGAVTFTFLRPEALGNKEREGEIYVYQWERDPLGGTFVLLAGLINPLIKEVHFEYPKPRPGEWLDPSAKLSINLTFDSLIAVIYWQLAGMYGGDFSRCQECGRIFPPEGKRIHCCDGCANKKKCRDYRRRKKEGKTKRDKQKRVRGRRRAANGHKRRHHRGH